MIIHLIAWANAVKDVVRDARTLRRSMHRKHGFIPE